MNLHSTFSIFIDSNVLLKGMNLWVRLDSRISRIPVDVKNKDPQNTK